MSKIILVSLFLIGCSDPYRTEYKCQDGTIYVKMNGAWIQSMVHKENKCLPTINAKPKQASEMSVPILLTDDAKNALAEGEPTPDKKDETE